MLCLGARKSIQVKRVKLKGVNRTIVLLTVVDSYRERPGRGLHALGEQCLR